MNEITKAVGVGYGLGIVLFAAIVTGMAIFIYFAMYHLYGSYNPQNARLFGNIVCWSFLYYYDKAVARQR